MSGGGRRGRGAEQHLHDPLAAQHRRRAVREGRQHQDAAVSEHPAAGVVGIGHPAEVAARHPRHAVVVAGEPLVDERVVGPIEVEQAAVLLHEVGEEQLGLAPHRAGEVLVVVRKEVRVRPDLVHVLQAEPLRREPGAQGLGPGVGEHAQRLPLQLLGRQAPRVGQRPQLFVGRRPPQEERQARGEVGVAQAVAAARRVDRRALKAQHEVRTGEHRLERGPHPRLEAAGGRALVEERQQPVDVARGQGPPVRLAAQPRDDAARAGPRLGRLGRTAREDAPAARGFGQARDLVGPADDEVADVRQRGDAGPARAAARERPVVGADQVLVGAVGPPDEGGRHPVRPRPHEDRRRRGGHAAPAVGVHAAVGVVVQQGHPLAVDRDVDVLDAGVGPRGERQLEDVLGVGGEDVVGDEAAPGAVGGALDVVPRMLRHVLGVGVGVVDGPAAGLADGEPADGARRVQIRLEQRRRQRLRIGDVVEVGAHRVERQPVAGVDVEGQQVADGPGVLGAVEALEGPAAGVGGDAGSLVELVLEGLGQGAEISRVGPARPGRRHHARAQLSHHRLGDLGVVGRRRRVEPLQRQVAAPRSVVVAGDARAAHHAVRTAAARRGLGGAGRWRGTGGGVFRRGAREEDAQAGGQDRE